MSTVTVPKGSPLFITAYDYQTGLFQIGKIFIVHFDELTDLPVLISLIL
jgi:hypothetical protein